MAVEVGEGFGIVGDHGVEVEGLRVGEVGVGHGHGDGGPVGGEPAAKTVGVVARAEVVVAGFGVAFLTVELVALRASVGEGVFAAEGIEIGIKLALNPHTQNRRMRHPRFFHRFMSRPPAWPSKTALVRNGLSALRGETSYRKFH